MNSGLRKLRRQSTEEFHGPISLMQSHVYEHSQEMKSMLAWEKRKLRLHASLCSYRYIFLYLLFCEKSKNVSKKYQRMIIIYWKILIVFLGMPRAATGQGGQYYSWDWWYCHIQHSSLRRYFGRILYLRWWFLLFFLIVTRLNSQKLEKNSS